MGERRAQPFQLGRLRDVLSRHLKLEDGSLYPALRASSDEAIRATVKHHQEEMGGLVHVCDARRFR